MLFVSSNETSIFVSFWSSFTLLSLFICHSIVQLILPKWMNLNKHWNGLYFTLTINSSLCVPYAKIQLCKHFNLNRSTEQRVFERVQAWGARSEKGSGRKGRSCFEKLTLREWARFLNHILRNLHYFSSAGKCVRRTFKHDYYIFFNGYFQNTYYLSRCKNNAHRVTCQESIINVVSLINDKRCFENNWQ